MYSVITLSYYRAHATSFTSEEDGHIMDDNFWFVFRFFLFACLAFVLYMSWLLRGASTFGLFAFDPLPSFQFSVALTCQAGSTGPRKCRAAILLAYAEAGALRWPTLRFLMFTGLPKIPTRFDSLSFSHCLVTWSPDPAVIYHASRCWLILVYKPLTSMDIHPASGSHPSRCVFLLF